jgi:hypothetical protein
MFRRKHWSAYSPTVNPVLKRKTTSTVAAVGENPSAKRRLPNYSLSTFRRLKPPAILEMPRWGIPKVAMGFNPSDKLANRIL